MDVVPLPKGFKHSDATKAKMRAKALGKKRPWAALGRDPEVTRKYWTGRKRPPEFGAAVAQRNRERTVSAETRAKMSLIYSGSGNPNWNGGVSRDTHRDPRYMAWAKAVKVRDNYTCQICGKRGGYLESDHIKSWKDYPKLRYRISNGRTLCKPCHILTPTWGRKRGRDRVPEPGLFIPTKD